MGDVNAILNGEIFILRGKMNSIANFERNAKPEGNVERNAKRENGLYKTFRMLRLLLCSAITVVQLQSTALCMNPVLHAERTSNASFITEFVDFSDFTLSQEKHLRRTRIFPGGDLFRTCTLIYRGYRLHVEIFYLQYIFMASGKI